MRCIVTDAPIKAGESVSSSELCALSRSVFDALSVIPSRYSAWVISDQEY